MSWPPPWKMPEHNLSDGYTCPRCGDDVPARHRHYWEPCRCTYLPANQPPHDPDPRCWRCEGSGYLPCQPQDMTFLRKWGACVTCGAWAFDLVDTRDGAVVEDGGRHAEGDQPDHVVRTRPVPLAESITNYLSTREDPSNA